MEQKQSKKQEEPQESNEWSNRAIMVGTLLVQGLIVGIGTAAGQSIFHKVSSSVRASSKGENVLDFSKSKVG